MNQQKREQIFRVFQQESPEPTSDLTYRNTFELLIAVILSAQATDLSVNKVTPALFAAAPDAKSIIELGEEQLKEKIKTIGLYNSKAKNIIACCHSLLENHQGEVPGDRKSLEKLAGVGQKTAGVVLNVAFNAPEIPVDTHVFRVSNRMKLVRAKTEKETEKALQKFVPEWAKPRAHHWLILHGRYTCKARTPLCSQCKVYEFCEWKDKPVLNQ